MVLGKSLWQATTFTICAIHLALLTMMASTYTEPSLLNDELVHEGPTVILMSYAQMLYIHLMVHNTSKKCCYL